MDNNFEKRLEEYLSSECNDYSMDYSWKWNENAGYCEVEIARYDYRACVNFKYNMTNNTLSVDMDDDNFYETSEFDWTVKYFWMIVAPSLFPEI
jgi:hypothetical protein